MKKLIIRFKRFGAFKKPLYFIIVSEKTIHATSGKVLERLGFYTPMYPNIKTYSTFRYLPGFVNPVRKHFFFNFKRAAYWLNNNTELSYKVAYFCSARFSTNILRTSTAYLNNFVALKLYKSLNFLWHYTSKKRYLNALGMDGRKLHLQFTLDLQLNYNIYKNNFFSIFDPNFFRNLKKIRWQNNISRTTEIRYKKRNLPNKSMFSKDFFLYFMQNKYYSKFNTALISTYRVKKYEGKTSYLGTYYANKPVKRKTRYNSILSNLHLRALSSFFANKYLLQGLKIAAATTDFFKFRKAVYYSWHLLSAKLLFINRILLLAKFKLFFLKTYLRLKLKNIFISRFVLKKKNYFNLTNNTKRTKKKNFFFFSTLSRSTYFSSDFLNRMPYYLNLQRLFNKVRVLLHELTKLIIITRVKTNLNNHVIPKSSGEFLDHIDLWNLKWILFYSTSFSFKRRLLSFFYKKNPFFFYDEGADDNYEEDEEDNVDYDFNPGYSTFVSAKIHPYTNLEKGFLNNSLIRIYWRSNFWRLSNSNRYLNWMRSLWKYKSEVRHFYFMSSKFSYRIFPIAFNKFLQKKKKVKSLFLPTNPFIFKKDRFFAKFLLKNKIYFFWKKNRRRRSFYRYMGKKRWYTFYLNTFYYSIFRRKRKVKFFKKKNYNVLDDEVEDTELIYRDKFGVKTYSPFIVSLNNKFKRVSGRLTLCRNSLQAIVSASRINSASSVSVFLRTYYPCTLHLFDNNAVYRNKVLTSFLHFTKIKWSLPYLRSFYKRIHYYIISQLRLYRNNRRPIKFYRNKPLYQDTKYNFNKKMVSRYRTFPKKKICVDFTRSHSYNTKFGRNWLFYKNERNFILRSLRRIQAKVTSISNRYRQPIYVIKPKKKKKSICLKVNSLFFLTKFYYSLYKRYNASIKKNFYQNFNKNFSRKSNLSSDISTNRSSYIVAKSGFERFFKTQARPVLFYTLFSFQNSFLKIFGLATFAMDLARFWAKKIANFLSKRATTLKSFINFFFLKKFEFLFYQNANALTVTSKKLLCFFDKNSRFFMTKNKNFLSTHLKKNLFPVRKLIFVSASTVGFILSKKSFKPLFFKKKILNTGHYWRNFKFNKRLNLNKKIKFSAVFDFFNKLYYEIFSLSKTLLPLIGLNVFFNSAHLNYKAANSMKIKSLLVLKTKYISNFIAKDFLYFRPLKLSFRDFFFTYASTHRVVINSTNKEDKPLEI